MYVGFFEQSVICNIQEGFFMQHAVEKSQNKISLSWQKNWQILGEMRLFS
jgi:hypothetical protein